MIFDMDIVIHPSSLSGSIEAIPSKSYAHRLLICAAMADRPSFIALCGTNDDIDATARCLKALGADIVYKDGGLHVTPISGRPKHAVLDCGESGSTLRFLLPVAAALGIKSRFIGRGRLPYRPLEPLISRLREHGCTLSDEHLPITVSGKLTGGVYELPGNISSQYITGLLLALPASGGGEIRIMTELQSIRYVEMTIGVMKQFGIDVVQNGSVYSVPAGVYRSPGVVKVPGDWSNAAVWLCVGALSGRISVSGLSLDDAQGDSAVVDILRKFGADVAIDGDIVTVQKAPLAGITVDAGNIPDIIPPVAFVAANACGYTNIINAGRLRLKESDRLSVLAHNLEALGCIVWETSDSLRIMGQETTSGGKLNGYNDHRIVMSAVVGGVNSVEGVTVSDSEAVNKSYPDFFTDFRRLGGKADVKQSGK